MEVPQVGTEMEWNGDRNGVEWGQKWCGMETEMVWNGDRNWNGMGTTMENHQ